MKLLTHFVALSMFFSAVFLTPRLQARSCTGVGDLVGVYGWVASRSTFLPVPAAAPGTTTPAKVIGSPTSLGTLLAGAVNQGPFVSTGVLFLDGNGGVFANSSSMSVLSTPVGSYTVNADCILDVSLNDAFLAGNGAVPAGSPAAAATFEGVILSTGGELDLVQTGAIAGTAVTLRKAASASLCTPDMLGGTLGLSASGATKTTSGTSGATTTTWVPFQLIGRIVPDGQGNLVTDVLAGQSADKRLLTGTYAVNPDCTGTAKLVDTTGAAKNATFVLVNPGNITSGPAQFGLDLVLTDANVTGTGSARVQ